MDQLRRGAGAPPHYPWHQWANGAAWKLLWGEDYYVSDKAFQAAVYAHAKAHGLTVTTRSIEGGLIIQFARQRRSEEG
jgi:hypothetical protein